MKSSPFKLFSLSAREADQRGNYANPELGRYKATTFDHPDLSGIKNSKPKAETEDSNTSSYQIPIKEWSSNLPKLDTSVSSRIESINSVTTRGSSGTFANNDERKYYEKAIAANMKQGLSKQAAIQKYRGDHNIGDVKRTPGVQNTYGQRTINGVVGEEYLQSSKPINMNGSPNKLIGDTMDPYGQPQRGNRDFTFNEKGIAPGTLGNQTSMGVQNQIYPGGQAQVAAEQLASQAATSQRADEMDFIGNPDSVLAMKGTPLHTKGHGVEQAHTHPTKTTTKISGKGEMPGSSYVENDYADEDASNAVGLSPHTATLVKTTRKGEPYIREKNAPKFPLSKFENFINENIGKAGAPRRSLSNFPRPDYISNEGDQLDPHNFLFQNTPKK